MNNMGNCKSAMTSINTHYKESLKAVEGLMYDNKPESKSSTNLDKSDKEAGIGIFGLDSESKDEFTSSRLGVNFAIDFLLTAEDRDLNQYFCDDGEFFASLSTIIKAGGKTFEGKPIPDECFTWEGKTYYEVLLERVVNLKKPLATVRVKRESVLKKIQKAASFVGCKIIGPYKDKLSGMNSVSLVHQNLFEANPNLCQLLSTEQRGLFPYHYDVYFNQKLSEYYESADIRSKHTFLECALVYGYPLDRALQQLDR